MDFNKQIYNEFTRVIGDPVIGEGTWIGPFSIIDGSGGLEIGTGCDISSGVQIYTHETVRRCVSGRAYNQIDRARTVIQNHVFIGANSTILMGSTIESNSVIAAGSIVKGVVPKNSIFAGCLAKKIGEVLIQNDGQVKLHYFDS
jgi:acetyltransferase-like isoleucine patch superfamily enzyme